MPDAAIPVRTKTTTLRREVVRADPEWARGAREEVQYEFSNGRKVKWDTSQHGAYAEDE